MLATRQIAPLPTPFERKVFSILKYAASGSDLALSRVKANAAHLVDGIGDVREICAAMIVDAWHVIDSARKVHKVLWTHRSRFESADLKQFISKYSCLKILRDYIQHIDDEVDGDPVSHAFMGTLTFCHQQEPTSVEVHLIMATALRSGAVEPHAGIHAGFGSPEPLSQFTLYVGNTKVRLDELVHDCLAVASAVMRTFDEIASRRPGAASVDPATARDDLYVVLKAIGAASRES